MEKDRKKKIITLLVIVFVTTLSIAFAAVSRTININGTAKMDTASWDIHFDNLSKANLINTAEEVNEPNYADNKGTIENINVKLKNPRDEVIYTVDIVNDGTMDAEVTVTSMVELTEEESKLFDFGVYYSDGTKIAKYDLLEAGDSKEVTIKLRYKDDITEFDLPEVPLTINFGLTLNYIQSDAEMVIVPDGNFELDQNGELILDSVVSTLAKGSDTTSTSKFFNGNIAKESVESITFLSTLKVPKELQSTAWDASLNKDGSVIAWYTDLDENGLYELNIGGNGKVFAPENSSYLFSKFSNLKEINFNNNLDTANVTNMSYIFYNCSSLMNVELNSLNTENITNMGGLFSGCSSLISVDLSVLNTSNLKNISQMFWKCSSLENINFGNFNTSNVTKMGTLFRECSSLTSIDLSALNTSNVQDMSQMFNYCKSLKNINFGNFNTSNVINMSLMFNECRALVNLDLSSFNTSKLETMQFMFGFCTNLKELNLNNFNTSNVTDMMKVFYGCNSLKSLNVSNWDTSKVTIMQGLFSGCNLLEQLDLKKFNTSNVININEMFMNCNSLKELDLSMFDLTNASNIWDMFSNCKNLNTIYLNNTALRSGMVYSGTFYNVPKEFTIYVLDETSKNIILNVRSDANVIIQPLNT